MMTGALIDAMLYGGILIFCMICNLGNEHGDGFKEMIPQRGLRRANGLPSFRRSLNG